MKIHNAKLQTLLEDMATRISQCDYIWELPWRGINNRTWPINAVTGNRYSGSNILVLLFNQLTRDMSGNWASYQQWSKAGRQVKKGQVGTPILMFKWIPDKNGEDGAVKPFWRYPTIFNETQLEDYTPLPDDHQIPSYNIDNLDLVHEIVKNCGANTVTGRSAFYTPSTDIITMPDKDSFITTQDGASAEENYLSTLLHELFHYALNERRIGLSKNMDIAEEECIVEIASVLMCTHIGISACIRDTHMAYVKGWGDKLLEDPTKIMQWGKIASQAFQWVLDQQSAHITADIDARQPERHLSIVDIDYSSAA